jgi:protein tyrosine phosphatase (PTP) superfamily phosphohydrolase (DUF442 family)
MAIRKWGLRVLWTLVFLLGLVAFYRPLLFDNNLHEVIPGQVYRSAQSDVLVIEEIKISLEIESILSVRPARPGSEWYEDELKSADELELFIASIPLNPNKMPAPKDLQALVDQLDHAPRPILIHCRRGVDRTGLAASIALILEGSSVKEARKQMGMRYGYFSWFSGSNLGKVLDRYEGWLADRKMESSPSLFRAWAKDEYVAAFYRAGIEIIDFPSENRVKTELSSVVRVTNESQQRLKFLSDPDKGVHLGVFLESIGGDKPFRRVRRAGLADLALAPGDSTEIEVRIDLPKDPGTYKLTLDLVNESVAWFSDMGSPKTMLVFEVLPAKRDDS